MASYVLGFATAEYFPTLMNSKKKAVKKKMIKHHYISAYYIILYFRLAALVSRPVSLVNSDIS